MTDDELAAALSGGGTGARKKTYTDDELAAAMRPVEPSHDIPLGVRAPDPEQPSTLGRLAREAGQSFVDFGKGVYHTVSNAGDFINRAVTHPVRTFGDHPAATVREVMRGVNSNIPFANKLVSALPGGAPEYSAQDAEEAPGANAFGSLAGTPLTGMTGSIAGKAIGGTAERLASSIRDPRKLSGRVLRDVGAAGGRVGLTGARGGLFESPELADLEKGRAGINDLAGKSTDRIIEDNTARLDRAREAFGQATDQIIATHGNRHIPVTATHAALDEIEANNTANNVTLNDAIASRVAKLREALTTDTGQLDMAASRATGQPQTIKAPAVKAEDLIKIRKTANRMARSADEADRYVYGRILDGLAEDAAAADPRIGQMNADYRREMQSLSTVNDALFGQKRPELKDSFAARQQGAGRLGRLGDETQAGTLAERRMEAAAEASPAAEREMLLNRAKKAQERLRLGGDATSTNIESGFGRAVKHGVQRAVGGAIGGVLGHAVGGPVGGAVGAGLGTAAAGVVGNPLALKLRLGLPALQAAGRLNPTTAVAADRLIEAARRRQEEQAHAAQRLLGGSQ